ncbi:hypothetical protein CUMW_141020 [Citrus unshiu]|nr:hypothetical protein CUMW_141020 [Citrus unshiu]GAY52334.1 hypothetical protein CUMW_141020 [Citrus unshiu]
MQLVQQQPSKAAPRAAAARSLSLSLSTHSHTHLQQPLSHAPSHSLRLWSPSHPAVSAVAVAAAFSRCHPAGRRRQFGTTL